MWNLAEVYTPHGIEFFWVHYNVAKQHGMSVRLLVLSQPGVDEIISIQEHSEVTPLHTSIPAKVVGWKLGL